MISSATKHDDPQQKLGVVEAEYSKCNLRGVYVTILHECYWVKCSSCWKHNRYVSI